MHSNGQSRADAEALPQLQKQLSTWRQANKPPRPYVERSGQVCYQDPHDPGKTWPHAVDFLADFVQHIPRARQHQGTYAGYFANARSATSAPRRLREIGQAQELHARHPLGRPHPANLGGGT